MAAKNLFLEAKKQTQMKKAKHFLLEELVCTHLTARDGDKAWRYIQPVVIDFLDWLREELGRPIYVNNYKWGGNKSQRGVRCNLCPLVLTKTDNNILYASAHLFGLAVDLNVKGLYPDYVRDWIKKNLVYFFNKYPHYLRQCRIEDKAYAPTWVHIDFFQAESGYIDIIRPIS